MISSNILTLLSLVAAPLVSAGVASAGSGVHISKHGTRPQCTVIANGGNQSDVSNILKAFDQCGHGGNILFPEDQNYYIAEKLNPVVNDVTIDWRGIWTVRRRSLVLGEFC